MKLMESREARDLRRPLPCEVCTFHRLRWDWRLLVSLFVFFQGWDFDKGALGVGAVYRFGIVAQGFLSEALRIPAPGGRNHVSSLDLSYAVQSPVHFFPEALKAVGMPGGRSVEEDGRSASAPQTRCRPMEDPAIGCPKEKNSCLVIDESGMIRLIDN